MGEDGLAFAPKDGSDFMPEGGVISSLVCVNGLGHIIRVSVNLIMIFIYILYKWFTQTLDLHAIHIIANTYMHNIGKFSSILKE